MSPSAASTPSACLAAVSPTPYLAMIPFRDGTRAPGASTPSRICARRSSSTLRYTASVAARSVGLDPTAPRCVGPDPTAPRCVGPDPTAPRSVGPDPTAPPKAPGLPLLGEGYREAVADRQHHQFHAVIGQDVLVELLDGERVGIRAGLEDPAVQERVVHQDDAAGPHPRHEFLPVTAVALLVGVDEGEVERAAGGQRVQRVLGRAEPQLDPVRQPRLLPVGTGQRGEVLVDVAADELPATGQPPGQAY